MNRCCRRTLRMETGSRTPTRRTDDKAPSRLPGLANLPRRHTCTHRPLITQVAARPSLAPLAPSLPISPPISSLSQPPSPPSPSPPPHVSVVVAGVARCNTPTPSQTDVRIKSRLSRHPQAAPLSPGPSPVANHTICTATLGSTCPPGLDSFRLQVSDIKRLAACLFPSHTSGVQSLPLLSPCAA